MKATVRAVLTMALSRLFVRALARPIARMAASMARAAKGDLSDVLEFDARTDELGELSRSIHAACLYLQEMSSVAGSLAAGDLRVQVTPRSDGDRLGQAFVAMRQRLSPVIGDVRKLAEKSQSAAKDIGALAASSRSLAERSGEVVGELVPSIHTTADLVRAMGRVEEVVQQSASAAGKLASTAHEMAAQAQALEQLVALFQLDGDCRAAPALTVPPAAPGAAPRVSLYLGDLARRRSARGKGFEYPFRTTAQ
jgi:methyl-accepting chemotaxis protein